MIFLNRRKLRKGKHRGTEFTEETKEHQLRVLCVSVFISSFLNIIVPINNSTHSVNELFLMEID